VAYSLASVLSYDTQRATLEDNHQQSKSCEPSCNQAQKDETIRLRDEYNANEKNAKDSAPIWYGVGIGGVLAIAGGIVLFVTAPASKERTEPSASVSAKVRVVPQIGPRANGLAVVGTF
jgi:hypothetical protein